MKTFLPMLAVAAVLLAASPAFAADADARREAARLAALRAEEATNRLIAGGATPPPAAQPAAPRQPAVDTAHVQIVAAGAVTLRSAGDLIGKRYALREIDGKEAPKNVDAFVEWRTGTSMTGRICNIFHATSTFEGAVLKAEELPAATKMACSDEVMGAIEERFFAALRLGMSFLAVGDSLELRRDDLLLRFTVAKEGAAQDNAAKTEAPPAEEPKPAAPAPEAQPAAAPEADETAPAAASPAVPAASANEPLVSEVIVLEEMLAGRKFVLRNVDGAEFTLTSGSLPYIEFGEGMRVGGSACNNFTGLGELEENVLKVPHAVATRKMCLDEKISEFERYFHQMLREGVEVAVDGGTLLLTGGGRMLEFVEE